MMVMMMMMMMAGSARDLSILLCPRQLFYCRSVVLAI